MLLAALTGPAVPASAQTPALKQIAQRVELYPIPTLTVSDQQFLTGDIGGTSVAVSGEFRIAQGQGKLPVVLLMHGSGGVGPNIEPWTQRLNAMGISTFVIDGFTGRGLVSTNTDQARLGRLNFIVDIYRALDILAKHPRVDTERIALMGFSRGGQAALYASLNRFHKLWNRSGVAFAVYIPFYPDCSTSYISDTEVADVPIRIFHGTPDDYNPVASCKAYAARLREAKRDIVVTEYPNAAHAFDTPLVSGPVVSKGSQTVRACQIHESEPGKLINAATSAPFSYKDDCVQLDPHVGEMPRHGKPPISRLRRFCASDFSSHSDGASPIMASAARPFGP
jgi:dienelactone hydrolase